MSATREGALEADLRQAVVDGARAMNARGINQGKSGNVSVRCGSGMLITPSGVAYEALTPAHVVAAALDGTYVGALVPSSEWRMHADIYRTRADAGAVVHTHSIFATALACLERPIPAFHYMVAVAGGSSVRCAPYATFGTQELSDAMLEALVDRRACLLAHHGVVALAADVEHALAIAGEVETLATMYCRALAIGVPNVLSDDEMRIVLRKFETYGRALPSAGAGIP